MAWRRLCDKPLTSKPPPITAITVVAVMIIFFTWETEIAIIACVPLLLSGKKHFG
jgi:hypothetical protein